MLLLDQRGVMIFDLVLQVPTTSKMSQPTRTGQSIEREKKECRDATLGSDKGAKSTSICRGNMIF